MSITNTEINERIFVCINVYATFDSCVKLHCENINTCLTLCKLDSRPILPSIKP